ncbi:transcription initiation factor TFIID subunit 5 [Klebsormidium nitens]|uniref:Transcription initiation factor TFIID subunit 5 n=1 Tax=Klebsormidium nitens TaxID=105231 RepID=A0A1Y1I4F2_KLENI|nr:transcription initiation factor TFIID subunit 5 [Klebsormidium nitens]|eukprot:GAQ82988.1 transcription initiation factor TFIID subunit 5 [Klebsormidium nitens]
MKAAAKQIALEAAKRAANEGGKLAFEAAVEQPLRLLGDAAEAGCQLTPLGLFNMGLGIVNLAVGATGLGVGIFNAYQVLKVKKDLGLLQIQTASIGVKTLEGLEKNAAEVRRVGAGLSADISKLSSQLGGLVIAEGKQTRVALEEMKAQLDLRLDRVDLAMGWVGKMVTKLAEKQGALSQQLAELQEGVRGLHALHKSAEHEEFQTSITLVADLYRDVLFQLQSGGCGSVECQELQREAKKLAAWTLPRLRRYAPGDLRRAPFMVAQVYALVAEVDARVLGEMLKLGANAQEGPVTVQSRQRPLCVQKLATLAHEVEMEARALLDTHASSPYALAVDVAPILSQYALLHRSIEAKQGVGRPVVFELHEASLAVAGPQVAVSWNDGLTNMRILSSVLASAGKDGGGSEWLEVRTVADVLWLAEVLEKPFEECQLADMRGVRKQVLLDALGVPQGLGDGCALEGDGLAALRTLAMPRLRESVEGAVNASFGSLETPLVMPTWPEVAGIVKEALQRLAVVDAERAEEEAQEHGKLLASVSYDTTVVVWDWAAGLPVRTLEASTDSQIAWSPDGQTLATASNDGTVGLWSVETGQRLHEWKAGDGPFWQACVAWSPNGGLLGIGKYEGIDIWDSRTGARVKQMEGHTSQITGLAWQPEGNMLASASWDKTAKVWDVPSGQPVQTITAHTKTTRSVCWSPDGRKLATAADDGLGYLWDLTDVAHSLRKLAGHSKGIYSVAWSPNGQTVATASEDTTVGLWQA